MFARQVETEAALHGGDQLVLGPVQQDSLDQAEIQILIFDVEQRVGRRRRRVAAAGSIVAAR